MGKSPATVAVDRSHSGPERPSSQLVHRYRGPSVHQPLYLIDAFNQGATTVPTSVYAPHVRYGISAATLQVNLTGQVAVVATPGPTVYPLGFTSGNGTAISSSNTTVTLSEVTDPKLLPPITALNLLFTIEKERTN